MPITKSLAQTFFLVPQPQVGVQSHNCSWPSRDEDREALGLDRLGSSRARRVGIGLFDGATHSAGERSRQAVVLEPDGLGSRSATEKAGAGRNPLRLHLIEHDGEDRRDRPFLKRKATAARYRGWHPG